MRSSAVRAKRVIRAVRHARAIDGARSQTGQALLLLRIPVGVGGGRDSGGLRARGSKSGPLSAAVAWVTCLVSGLLALGLVRLFHGREAVSCPRSLLGMFPRMGIPLAVCMVVYLQGGRLAEAGFVYYILVFYFVTLVVETVLLVGEAQAATDREVNGLDHGQRKRTATDDGEAPAEASRCTAPRRAAEAGASRWLSMRSHDPLSAETLMHHVKDADHFLSCRACSVRRRRARSTSRSSATRRTPIVEIKTGFAPLDNLIEPLEPADHQVHGAGGGRRR